MLIWTTEREASATCYSGRDASRSRASRQVFVLPMKTTCTAANLGKRLVDYPTIADFVCFTYAAVDANISAALAEVSTASVTENMNDMTMAVSIRIIRLRIKYRMMMASEGISVEATTASVLAVVW